jgi:hypothetical protein
MLNVTLFPVASEHSGKECKELFRRTIRERVGSVNNIRTMLTDTEPIFQSSSRVVFDEWDKLRHSGHHFANVHLKGDEKRETFLQDIKEHRSLAYLISIHDDQTLRGLLNIVEEMYHPDDVFVIHADLKVSDCMYEELRTHYQGFPNVHFTVRRYEVRWGDFGIVKMTLEMLKTALEVDASWSTVVNLCGNTRPTTSRAYRHFLLGQHPKDVNFLGKLDKVSERNHKIYHRTPARCIPTREQNKSLSIAKSNCLQMSRTPGHHLVYKGEQWFIFSRPFASYVMHDHTIVPRWLKFFSGTEIPDESFFQSIIMSSPYNSTVTLSLEDRVHNLSFSAPIYTSWEKPCLCRKHVHRPCFLGVEDLHNLIGYSLFARKIVSKEPLSDLLHHTLLGSLRLI